MIVQSPKFASEIVSAVLAVLYWGIAFWRIVRRNRGNMVVECGCIAIMVILTMAFLSRVINLPGWAFGSSLALVFLLCVATLIFFIIEIAEGRSSKKAQHHERHLKHEFPEDRP